MKGDLGYCLATVLPLWLYILDWCLVVTNMTIVKADIYNLNLFEGEQASA